MIDRDNMHKAFYNMKEGDILLFFTKNFGIGYYYIGVTNNYKNIIRVNAWDLLTYSYRSEGPIDEYYYWQLKDYNSMKKINLNQCSDDDLDFISNILRISKKNIIELKNLCPIGSTVLYQKDNLIGKIIYIENTGRNNQRKYKYKLFTKYGLKTVDSVETIPCEDNFSINDKELYKSGTYVISKKDNIIVMGIVLRYSGVDVADKYYKQMNLIGRINIENGEVVKIPRYCRDSSEYREMTDDEIEKYKKIINNPVKEIMKDVLIPESVLKKDSPFAKMIMSYKNIAKEF